MSSQNVKIYLFLHQSLLKQKTNNIETNGASHLGLFCLLAGISSKKEANMEKYLWCPLK